MIALRINGGLGNQLFQYAAARYLSNRHNVEIGIDTTSLNGKCKEGNFRRKFKLGKFNSKFKKLSLKEIRKYVWITGNKYIDDYIIKRFCLFEKNVYHEGDIEKFKSLPSDICLIGYFADKEYFDEIREILKKELKLKDNFNIKSLQKEISQENSVMIHVRRGDLVKMKNTHVLKFDYYKKAIEIISREIINPKFYIFSDDVEWCKKNFDDLKNKFFVQGSDVSEDFELMKKCNHKILANSTLSWWAGYLNERKNSIIISPKHFSCFKNKKSDIQLEEWIEI